MDEREQEIARAKVRSAVGAAREMLAAASKAAHELKQQEDEEFSEEDDFGRVIALGYVVDAVSSLCEAHLKVLYDVALVLHEIEHGETERPEREQRN
jgi:hypothetical protein